MQRIRQLWGRFFGARLDSVSAPTRLIVGLGNPGAKFAWTRHNIGFRIVEKLASEHGAEWQFDRALNARIASIDLEGECCLLLEPQTFMNRSGAAVAAALERWPQLDRATDLLVVYDDLDLPTGRIRLRPSGGAGGHRGIGDVLLRLDTKAIPRLRFGVGHPGSASGVLEWVLAPFDTDEESECLQEATERAVSAIQASIRLGLTSAMGQFNSNS
jgi:PTH1 family peptidyl-tRNA hydrolase